MRNKKNRDTKSILILQMKDKEQELMISRYNSFNKILRKKNKTSLENVVNALTKVDQNQDGN